MVRLGHRDYNGAIELVAEAAASDGMQPFECAVVERLLGLVPADCAGYYEFRDTRTSHPAVNMFFAAQPLDWPHVDWCSAEVGATVHSWPLLDARTSASVLPLRLSDFLTPEQLRRNAWYDAVQRPRDVAFEIKAWLPAPPGLTRAFFLVRASDRRDFTERDRAVLALLRPHLASIRDRWERRHRPPLLTAREAEVLDLVAKGLTNAEVGADLFLSRTTVRTHLENIFEKLGVHTRSAAVARAFDQTG